MRWRLLVSQPARGAWNMAVDEAMARAVASDESPPTVRFFRWHPPCLSLGCNQPYGVVDEGFCRRHGVDITRRPTGGRAVLHHHELTYSVVAPLGLAPLPRDLQGCYRLICQCLIVGLRRLGVAAELSAAPDQLIGPKSAAPCFIQPAGGEVVVDGRKLVGSAMRRFGPVILQHGSLLLDWDSRLQAGCLSLASDQDLRPVVVTLRDLLGEPPPWEELVQALALGFAQVLEADLAPAALSSREEGWAARLAQEVYGSPTFVVHRQRPGELEEAPMEEVFRGEFR
ncbi:MAG: lipoate--protein ligase family protein [Thermoanaerobaculum sp.]|nr:lipoate--protein ligase family protein [Thermoanaerobaculum sp.]